MQVRSHYLPCYCVLWQGLSYYGHPPPWGPAGLHNASLTSSFVNGNRVWCSRMSDRLQAHSHSYAYAHRELKGVGVGYPYYGYTPSPGAFRGCDPILSCIQAATLCTQAANLCTQAATLCTQAEEWEDPWLTTIAPPGLGRAVPRPYDKGHFPVRYAYCMTLPTMTTRAMP